MDARQVARPSGANGYAIAGIAFVLTMLSRIPFLGPGYGIDSDAWRIGGVARIIADTGMYAASRAPGYPLHEIVCALLIPGGATALCAASAFMSALAVAFFALVAWQVVGRNALLLAIALAATPALYLGSIQALDYAWALAFALGGWLAALNGRARLAGIAVGLAIGCRLSSGLWLVPIAITVWQNTPDERRGRAVLDLLILSLTVGLIAFAPVLLASGFRFLHHYGHGYPSLLVVFKNATLDLVGIPGTIALALAGIAGVPRGRRSWNVATPRQREVVRACAAGIPLFVAAFLYLPHEAAYLIPVLPLALLMGAVLLPRAVTIGLCAALILSPWALKIVDTAGQQPGADTTGVLTRFGRYALETRGPIQVAQSRRSDGMRYVSDILTTSAQITEPTVIEAHEWLPQIRVRSIGKTLGPVEFVYALGDRERNRLRAGGTHTYALRDVP